jgi:hypothetical protein
MALSPQYAATPIIGSAVVNSTAETSYTSPTRAVTVLSAAPITVASVTTASGSQFVTIASGTFSASIGPGTAQTQAWVAGMQLFGTGIAPGTTIVAVSGTTAEISLPATASGTVSLTAVSNGIKVDELKVVATGTSVAGNVQTYLYDGTNYHPDWSFELTAITPSSTQVPFYQAQQFDNLEIPSGWSLCVASFVNSQLATVTAIGGSL